MKFRLFLAAILLTVSTVSLGQSIRQIDGSKISVDCLNSKIEHLMKVANVSGVAVAVFNKNKLVFNKTFGFTNVKEKIPLEKTSVIYAASFAKMVFAYIALQHVQEGLIDLDKPFVQYLNKPLPDFKINGFRRG